MRKLNAKPRRKTIDIIALAFYPPPHKHPEQFGKKKVGVEEKE